MFRSIPLCVYNNPRVYRRESPDQWRPNGESRNHGTVVRVPPIEADVADQSVCITQPIYTGNYPNAAIHKQSKTRVPQHILGYLLTAYHHEKPTSNTCGTSSRCNSTNQRIAIFTTTRTHSTSTEQ
jgi:hypothetical protein